MHNPGIDRFYTHYFALGFSKENCRPKSDDQLGLDRNQIGYHAKYGGIWANEEYGYSLPLASQACVTIDSCAAGDSVGVGYFDGHVFVVKNQITLYDSLVCDFEMNS